MLRPCRGRPDKEEGRRRIGQASVKLVARAPLNNLAADLTSSDRPVTTACNSLRLRLRVLPSCRSGRVSGKRRVSNGLRTSTAAWCWSVQHSTRRVAGHLLSARFLNQLDASARRLSGARPTGQSLRIVGRPPRCSSRSGLRCWRSPRPRRQQWRPQGRKLQRLPRSPVWLRMHWHRGREQLQQDQTLRAAR